jgi:GntR family transcriptional regulator/MocR family aminotransferase
MKYLVLPPSLIQRYHEQKFRKYSSTVSRIEQRAMQLFMQKGNFTKHVR